VLAIGGEGAVAGFTFGHNLTADTRWWDGALTTLPVEATERPQDVFAIIELAVRQSCRRQGVARLLLDELVAGVHADRTTLLVRPEIEADPAQRAYGSWGYRRIGQIQPWPDAPIYDALLRRMPEERRVSH
jgi:ribosomal protein S18 acetylase RimI-like enzyme